MALMMALHRRLGVISGRIERLVARFAAGTVWRRVTRAARPETEAAVAARAVPVPVWPRTFGWLVTLMAHRAALYTCQMEIVLAEPAMIALLREVPQAARILRPMCRMLGVSPALLRPGEVAAPRLVKPRVPIVRRVRPPIDWGRIPLPRGVLSAARRAGFKPVR